MLDALIVVGDEGRDRAERTLRLAWPDAAIRFVANGRGAIDESRDAGLDLVVLDLGLPGEAGWEVLAATERLPATAVIGLVPGRAGDGAWRQAIELGVDDYLLAPFPPIELLARAGAALRLRQQGAPMTRLPDLSGDGSPLLDPRGPKARLGDNPAGLTRAEQRFLDRLALQPNAVVTTRALLSALWGPEGQDRPEFPEIYARRIRERIEPDPAVARYLFAERGIGFRLKQR